MKNARARAILIFLPLALFTTRSYAEETFAYPELSVVPRASDRIEMEAKKQDSGRWTDLLQIEIPAATLLAASIIQAQPGNIDPSQDANRISPWVGGAVGVGWLAYGVLSSMGEPVYVSAANELRPLPKGSVREQLTRERVAEELLQHKAHQMRLVRLMATVTMVGSAIYMNTAALGSGSGGAYSLSGTGVSKVIDIGAAVVGLAPLFLRTHYEEVAAEQMRYKKRIYAPVASSALFRTSSGAVPGVALTWNF